jgi:hypothetical protein
MNILSYETILSAQVLRKHREKRKERQVTSPSKTPYWNTSLIYPLKKGTDGPFSYPASSHKAKFRHNFRVLVPGAGLGRLAYDVAKLGELSNYASQPINEPSIRIFLPRKRVFALYAAGFVLYS